MSKVVVHEMQYYGDEVNSEIELVNYSEKDYEDYRKICCDCFRSLSLSTGLDPDEFYTEEEMNKKKDNVFIMFINEEMIGSVEIYDNTIDHLFVNEKYQNKGYGTKLLNFAISYLQKLGQKELRLLVADLNENAVSLYLKNGFKIVNTIVDTWGE